MRGIETAEFLYSAPCWYQDYHWKCSDRYCHYYFCCRFIFNCKSKCVSWMRFISSVKRILLPFLGDNRNEYSCRWRLLRVAVCCPAMGISIKWNVLLMRCESLDWLLACRQSSLKFKTWEGIVTFSLIHSCSKGRTSVVFAHWWLSMVVWRLLVRYSLDIHTGLVMSLMNELSHCEIHRRVMYECWVCGCNSGS